MIPVGANRVVFTYFVFVFENLAIFDLNHHVVTIALGRNMQTMHVKVGWLTDLIYELDPDCVTGVYHHCRAWQAGVVGNCFYLYAINFN